MQPTESNIALMEKFVRYCAERLELSGDVNIVLSMTDQDMPTAGHFDVVSKRISVTIKNRAIADCFRTVAHEMTHLAQLKRGTVFPEDDVKLQPYEDEANIMSGRFVRFFGRENQEIYQDLA